MNGHKIIFDDTEWVNAGIGMRYKAFIHDNQRVRFVEFSDGFIEPDWCTRGHVGIVLDGNFTIDYDGSLERYIKGDIIFIPGGEASKHKAVLILVCGNICPAGTVFLARCRVRFSLAYHSGYAAFNLPCLVPKILVRSRYMFPYTSITRGKT